MAPQATEKICENCSKVFTCNAATVADCACSTIKVSPQTRLYLQEKFAACICVDCLRQMNEQVNAGEEPGQKTEQRNRTESEQI